MLSTITLSKPEEAAEIARTILQSREDRRVFTLSGELGAGKTTLIKGFCEALGVGDHASSPSFAIVNEYRGAGSQPVYHFDLFRLRDASELEGIGFDEYVDSGAYCFIEWPEIAAGRLPADVVHLQLLVASNGVRTISISTKVASGEQ